MNRDEIWQKLKDETETIYGKKMLDIFLSVTEKLDINHLEEALNSGYDVSDSAIKYNLNDILDTRPELLDKIISNKKDMSSKLMLHILDLSFSYGRENAKEIAKKLNLNKMTIDDTYILAWISLRNPLKIENIEQIHEIFGDKLKQFDIKQIMNLVKEGARWKIEGILDKIVNSVGGWRRVAKEMREKMLDTPEHYYWKLKASLNDSGFSEYFAKKIIENDKNAIELAKYFYPEIGNTQK